MNKLYIIFLLYCLAYGFIDFNKLYSWYNKDNADTSKNISSHKLLSQEELDELMKNNKLGPDPLPFFENTTISEYSLAKELITILNISEEEAYKMIEDDEEKAIDIVSKKYEE